MKAEWSTRRVVIDLLIETYVERDGTIRTTIINTAASNAKHVEIATLTRVAPDWRVANGADETLFYGSTKAEAIHKFESMAARKAATWAVS